MPGAADWPKPRSTPERPNLIIPQDSSELTQNAGNAILSQHDRLADLEEFRRSTLHKWAKETDNRLHTIENSDSGYLNRLKTVEKFRESAIPRLESLESFKANFKKPLEDLKEFQLETTKKFESNGKTLDTYGKRLDKFDEFQTSVDDKLSKLGKFEGDTKKRLEGLEKHQKTSEEQFNNLKALTGNLSSQVSDVKKTTDTIGSRVDVLDNYKKDVLDPFVASTKSKLASLDRGKLEISDYLAEHSKTNSKLKALDDVQDKLIAVVNSNQTANEARFTKLEKQVVDLENKTNTTNKELDGLKTTVTNNHTNLTSQVVVLQQNSEDCYKKVKKVMGGLSEDVLEIKDILNKRESGGGFGFGGSGGHELSNYNSPRGTNIKLHSLGDINFSHSPICSRYQDSGMPSSCTCGAQPSFPMQPMGPPSFPTTTICPITGTPSNHPHIPSMNQLQASQQEMPICINNSANAVNNNHNNSFNRDSGRRSYDEGRDRDRDRDRDRRRERRKEKSDVMNNWQSFSGPTIRLNLQRDVPGGLFGKGRKDSLGFFVGGGRGESELFGRKERRRIMDAE